MRPNRTSVSLTDCPLLAKLHSAEAEATIKVPDASESFANKMSTNCPAGALQSLNNKDSHDPYSLF
jgi:hypothetical protein